MTLSFRLKMVLLAICITSAAAFGGVARRAAAAPVSGAGSPVTAGVRFTVVVTLVLWVGIIFLGRAIAYDDSVWGSWSPVKSLGGAAT